MDKRTIANPPRSFEALGQRIKARREEIGLSLRDIATRTRIPLSTLQAIETGDPLGLPAPVFVKGFLRSYCIEIGLRPEEIVGEYKSYSPERTEWVGSPKTKDIGLEGGRRLWLVVVPLIILAVLGGSLSYFYPKLKAALVQTDTVANNKAAKEKSSKSKTSTDKSSPAVDTTVSVASAPSVTPVAGLPHTTTGPTETKPDYVPPAPSAPPTILPSSPITQPAALPASMAPAAAPPIPSPAMTPSPPARVAATKPTTGPGQPVSTAAQPAPTAAGPHELKLVFSQSSWIQISVDEKAVQHGFFQAGVTKTWKGDKGFTIRIGNAGAVQVFMDGKDLGPAGQTGQVVKLILPPAGR